MVNLCSILRTQFLPVIIWVSVNFTRTYHSCLHDEKQRAELSRVTYLFAGYYVKSIEVIITSPTVVVYGLRHGTELTTPLEQR